MTMSSFQTVLTEVAMISRLIRRFELMSPWFDTII